MRAKRSGAFGAVLLSVFCWASAAMAQAPVDWQLGLQRAATPVKHQVESFHDLLMVIITAITIFVLGLLVYVSVRFRASANPVPSKTTHNTLIEVLWTVVPVIILVVIAVPSFRLLYFMEKAENPEMTIKATGYQWYWGYEYPDHGAITFTANMLPDNEIKPGMKRVLETDNRVVVPVDTTVRLYITAADVRRELDVKDRPIHVIPLGLASAPPASASRPGFLADGRPFLLSIGTALAHKNFHSLFDLLEEFTDHRLVIAGNFATRYGEFLQGQVVQKRLQDRVLMPGEVSDPDRQWLYKRCEAFLFPSLSEGFGLPVLEAMAAGRPVFVSRRTSLPEITGEHGFYFDSFEPKAMAMAVREGLARFEADTGFAARARSHAEAFTWAETTRRYADLYEQLVAG
jgi:heme/copper-type cytochrome/quinol oxidase subunit 2